VLIEEMGVREVAGKPQRFEYAFTLREFTAAAAPESEEPPPTRRDVPDPEVATLEVEVIVEGDPNFDFSNTQVTAEGTPTGGTPLTRTLTQRENNVWTERDFPPGQFTARVVVPEPAMTGSAPAIVRAGQTTRATVTLQRGQVSNIATTFVVHFRFDKAFVEPCMRHVLKQVADHATAHSDERLIILGHTDKVGPPEYNQSLSERRARTVYAYLTMRRDRTASLTEWNAIRERRPAGEQPSIKDTWDVREYQHILQDLGFYPGAVDGDDGPLTQEAVRAYRCHKGLPPGTNVDAGVWQALIEDYLSQDNLTVPANQFLPNCGKEIVKWLGCGEEDPVRNVGFAWRPNRRTELIFVRTTSLPCDAPQPDTFDLLGQGSVNSSWCVGPTTGTDHCCFVTVADPQRQNVRRDARAFTRTPVEPGTFTVEGLIRRELPNGTLQPVANQAFVLIAPNGEFKGGEQSNGEPSPARTNANGQFTFANLPAGFYSLEVVTPANRPLLVRPLDEPNARLTGNVICRELHVPPPGGPNPRLDVVIVNAPVLREIRLPIAVHIPIPLDSRTGGIRECPSASGAATPQVSQHTDAEIRQFFEDANLIWRQARVHFEVTDIVREAYIHPIADPTARGSCEVDDAEFQFLLHNSAYPDAVNVYFFRDFAGAGEAGMGISVETGATGGLPGGAAVADRAQTIFGGANIDIVLTREQSAQALAHELGHYLNLDHVTDTPTNADRLMLPGTLTGANRTLAPDEVTRARTSRGATDDCVPLTLRVTGATQVGGALSNQFIVVQNPGGVVTVDADIPDRLIAPGVGTLTMTGGTSGANPRQQTVSASTAGLTEIVATYTPTSGGQPVTARVVIRVVTFTLRVEGACQLGDAASTNFITAQSSSPTDVMAIRTEISPALFSVPDNLITWNGGTATVDPQRRTAPRTNTGTFSISATLAGTTRTVALQVVTFTLRVEGAPQVGAPGANTFAVVRDPAAAVTVIAEISPPPTPVPPDLVTWVGGAPIADPLRRRIARTPAAEVLVRATLCGVTRDVTIQVVGVANITKAAPARPIFDEISDPHEPVLTVCERNAATLRIDITPDTTRVFYTTNPNNVVDLNPPSRVGDGEVIVQPRALPTGTNRASGRDTKLSVRIVSPTGPEAPRNGQPARVRIRQFERTDVHLFLHLVRNDAGNIPGTTLNDVTNNFNTALAEANTLWSRACIRLVPRLQASGALDIDFIDETDLLDISATFDGTGSVTFPGSEDNTLFNIGGVDRNAANPTFINVYSIDRFDGAPTLGGVGGGNHLIIQRTMSGSLLAHELGHCLGLPDLDKVVGITDLDKRLMRSATPRGETLTSSGTAGDEIRTARDRAASFPG
jgi:outer membrane protein OmpA-like peptidoglycan-associated protein/peptidoglycan hydrolase-like protein with peptidoglycan-binding domain